jgi:hypothetical protein
MNLTQLETIETKLKREIYGLNKAAKAKPREKLTTRGLT